MVKIYKLSDFDSKEEMLEKINELNQLLDETYDTIQEMREDIKTLIERYNCCSISPKHNKKFCEKYSLNMEE